METFGVLLIAVDDYPDPPGALPSSDSAKRLSKIVVGDRGGTLIESVIATSQEEIIVTLERWAAPDARVPSSSLVYLVGHGSDDGLDHNFIVPTATATRDVRTSELARFFQSDWFRRQSDAASWTLFILDCCAADVGVTNLQNALTAKAIKRPKRLSLWPVTPQGASHSGSFVDALERALTTFTENDADIPLNELFRRMQPDLGDLEADGQLPENAALRNPLHTPTPTVMNLDTHAELRRVIRELPADVRNHFLTKAQGTEAGDLAWYFSGLHQEIQLLSKWLRESTGGLRVVTGEPGSGKSALLGHLLVLSDDVLVGAYLKSGLAPDLATHVRPPSEVFDATLHLTGRTLAQTLDDLRKHMGARGLAIPNANTPDEFLRELTTLPRPFTVLADALDEAQEPIPIADFLRQAVAANAARVVIGTRRSPNEGPDQPLHPMRRELIDALAARDADLIVIGRDRTAMQQYVVRRLSAATSPYAGNRALIDALAARVASTEQPMLFARLVTSELLARPPLSLDHPVLAGLLKGSHRDVFEAAVQRLTTEDPAAVVMLRALALSRGRGLPETAGIWPAVARGIGETAIPDNAVRRTIEVAAPYVMLDAEAGQSVYRLAHRTFVEYFRNQPAAALERRKATDALQTLVAQGDWGLANFYPVRYLPEHFTDPDRATLDVDGLAALAINPRWLSRAMALLGVDAVVDTLASARRWLEIPLVETIERVLRRSRVALSRDPAQLAGQVHARLHESREPRLASIGQAIGQHADMPWLRMQYGELEWHADLETTYTMAGKVRALAFEHVDGQPLVAIGIDDVIRLWDPRRGQGSDRVLQNGGRRPTALALAKLDGRPVVVVASAYDGVAVIRELRDGAQIGPAFEFAGYVSSIALGRLGDRIAVAAVADLNLVAWDAHTGQTLTDVHRHFPDASVRGVAQLDGRVVAFIVRQETAVSVVDIASRAELWREPQHLPYAPKVISATGSGENFVAAAVFFGSGPAGSTFTWRPAHPSPLDGHTPADEGSPIRTAVPGEIAGTRVIALAPDFHNTALVSIRVPSADRASQPASERAKQVQTALEDSRVEAVFALRSTHGAARDIVLLTNSPVSLIPLNERDSFDASPDPHNVSFALTGSSRRGLNFLGEPPLALLGPPPARKGGVPGGIYRLEHPADWPTSSHAYGIVDDRPAIAVGSIGGSVWIWDIETTAPIAGPLLDVPMRDLVKGWPSRALRSKGAPAHTSAVALGQHRGKGDIVAFAHAGKLRVVTVSNGEPIATPAADVNVVTAVALGQLLGEDVLVTGSQGGAIIVWGFASNKRLAALTIDSPVEKVWVVRGAEAVAVQTKRRGRPILFVLDMVCEV